MDFSHLWKSKSLETWLVVLTRFNHLEKWWTSSMGFGWHPIYEMENKTCSKPPSRYSEYKYTTIIYHLVMTNIAMENPNHKWRFSIAVPNHQPEPHVISPVFMTFLLGQGPQGTWPLRNPAWRERLRSKRLTLAVHGGHLMTSPWDPRVIVVTRPGKHTKNDGKSPFSSIL